MLSLLVAFASASTLDVQFEQDGEPVKAKKDLVALAPGPFTMVFTIPVEATALKAQFSSTAAHSKRATSGVPDSELFMPGGGVAEGVKNESRRVFLNDEVGHHYWPLDSPEALRFDAPCITEGSVRTCRRTVEWFDEVPVAKREAPVFLVVGATSGAWDAPVEHGRTTRRIEFHPAAR